MICYVKELDENSISQEAKLLDDSQELEILEALGWS